MDTKVAFTDRDDYAKGKQMMRNNATARNRRPPGTRPISRSQVNWSLIGQH